MAHQLKQSQRTDRWPTARVRGSSQSSPEQTHTQQQETSSTWVATIILLGMITAAGYYFYAREPEFPPPLAAIDGLPGAEGASHPAADVPTRTIDGQVIQLKDLRGKVVVIDFWATWCPPCRQEIPHLVRLSEKYRHRGLEIVALTIEDPETDQEKIRRFMERFKINYTVGYATDTLFTDYIGPGQQPIPQTLIFDRQGRLRAHLISFDARRDPPRLESLISRLL